MGPTWLVLLGREPPTTTRLESAATGSRCDGWSWTVPKAEVNGYTLSSAPVAALKR